MIDQCVTFSNNANIMLEIWSIALFSLFYIMINLYSYSKKIHLRRTNWSIATWKLIMKICNKLMKLLRKIILDCEPERKFAFFIIMIFRLIKAEHLLKKYENCNTFSPLKFSWHWTHRTIIIPHLHPIHKNNAAQM